MSWVVEEWKEGLSPRVLQKIHELESQVDKLKKERQQRQFQLDSLEAALQKQKQKVENEKNETASLKRENQSLMELCDSLDKAKQKNSHDLQVKESQVNILSAQLSSSKKEIERLEQELKRYKCELERSQQTLIAADLSFSGSPQKSFTGPLTPIQSHNDAKFEELEEKYKKEVQERKKLELELRTIQVKKINQPYPQRSTLSHKEIARHQTSSSVFPWQQEKTPSRIQETPAKKSSSTPYFPWEKEGNSSIISEKNKFDNSLSEDCNSSLIIQLRAQNQELNSSVKNLEQQLQDLEKGKKSHMNKLQEVELLLDKTKLELTEKDKVLNKTREKLTQMKTQFDQATAQVQTMEQKMKKLSEELNCQRQNAESARQSLEQKIKAKEKEYQEELSRQQRSLQKLDQENNNVRNKLNQDLQQAKNDYNALQAEFDKVMAVKQRLEHDTSSLTQKLCGAEQALLAAQAKETDFTRNFEEVKKEKNLLDAQYEKKLQEIHQLEEELETVKQSLKQSQNFAEEMKNKNTSQEAELKLLEEKLIKQENSLSLEKLKLALADMEKQQDSTKNLLKEKENQIKEQNCKISKMEEELDALQKLLGFKQRECEELKKETSAFCQWRNENDCVINKLKLEKEDMLAHISDLESSLQSQQTESHKHSEKLRIMETERDRKNVEIEELRNMLGCKSAELEEQKKVCDELRQEAESSDKKYGKDIENMSCKILQLTNQVSELEGKMQLAANEGLQREQCYHELLGEYEKICCLVKAKDASEMTEGREGDLQNGQDEIVLDNKQLAANNLVTKDHKCARALLEKEKTEDLMVLQDQISSLEISPVAQEQLNSDQPHRDEDLLQVKSKSEERLCNVEQRHESSVMETNQHISGLQADISAHQKSIRKMIAIIKEKDMELQSLRERLENQQAVLQDLKINNKFLEDSVRQLKLMSETWDTEKKDTSSVISSYSKEIEELTNENATLKDISRDLEQNQVSLREAIRNISNSLKGKEEIISEMSRKHKEEKQCMEARTEEITRELTVLQARYKLLEEENVNMMNVLREQTVVFEEKKAELEQEEKLVLNGSKDILHKLIAPEEIEKNLIQELQQLQSYFSDVECVPSPEHVCCLKQEMSNVKATQSAIQEQHDTMCIQGKEQLVKELETKSEPLGNDFTCERRLCSDQLRKTVEEKDIELNKYQLNLELLQMDLEDREISLENYRLEVMQLKTTLKKVETELEISVREKERLMQELLSVEELKNSHSQLRLLSEGGHLEYNDDCLSQNSGKRGMDELVLPSALQEMTNKLSELEKMCERLQNENIAFTSAFSDGITDINKVAEERENIINTNLRTEKPAFQDELMDQSDDSNLRMGCDNKEIPIRFKECSTGSNSDYEGFKLSSEEVKIHFAEIKEKFFSFQNEHIKLYEQHCSMLSKIAELQSYILKAENSALSASMSNIHIDSPRMPLSSSQNGTQSKLDGSKSTDALFDISFSELSKVNDSCNSGMYKWTEEINQLKSPVGIIPRDAAKILSGNDHSGLILDSVEELRSSTPSKSNPEDRIKELEMLCQIYEKTIKVLQNHLRIQENMKTKEIQELKKSILSEREEMGKQQNLSNKKEWQQELTYLTAEMEYKLAEERKADNLSFDLKTASLQLQVLKLSTHSLLCTDSENTTQQENIDLYQLGVPDGDPALKKDKPKVIPLEKTSIGGTVLHENITEATEEKLVEACSDTFCREECRNMSGKNASPSHDSALSLSNSSAFFSSEDFSESEISTETHQEEMKQETVEDSKVICAKECHENIDFLMGVKELNSQVNLQNTQLTLENSVFAELEETGLEKEENGGIKEKLGSVSANKQQLSLALLSLEKKPEKISSKQNINKSSLSNTTDMLDDTEVAKGDCHDLFLEAESEQRQAKSEQVNTEIHALFVEGNAEILQAKCHQLEKDREINLKTIPSLKEQLVSVTAERNHTGQEQNVLSENKELEQENQKLQEKVKELESNKEDSAEIIRRLESEVQIQINLFETAKSDADQLSDEKVHLLQKLLSLEKDASSFRLEEEKLQNQVEDLNKEKEVLVRESEILQNKLNASEMENSALSRSLEGLISEKGELAARLNSAQKEVNQMRQGIEKLKIKIESDERKKIHIAEKLKENERKTDALLDKVERLERELEMSEENLEDAVVQLETAKAEAETLTMEKEEMAEKLKCLQSQIDDLTSQKVHLSKESEEKQERILELESSNVTTAKLLQEKEKEKMQIKAEFENTVLLLKTELKCMSEKLEFSSKEEAVAREKEQVLLSQVACLEQDKTMLLQECQELKNENINLDHTRELLAQEFLECKQKLEEKLQENHTFQQQIKETEELSLQLTHMEHERESWHQEKQNLQNLIVELKLMAQPLTDNGTFPDILNILKVSYKDLEKELESTLCEKTALCKKVNEQSENCIKLEAKLSDTEQAFSKLQEEFTTERNKLAEQIQHLQEHSEKNKIDLHLVVSEKYELRESLVAVQKELQEKENIMKREISVYQDRLLQTEKEHHIALTEINRKNEIQIEACQEKMNSLEHFVSSQKLEIEHLKSTKEELSNSLKEANQTLGGLLNLKAENINTIIQLNKEKELVQSEVQLWIKSCKQMEQEKEVLQKQLAEYEELFKRKDLNFSEKEGTEENVITEEIKLELEELQEAVEVKTREANENLEKYCSLIVKYYKLEEANEMLKTQVTLLNGQLKQQTSDAVISPLLNSGNSSTVSSQIDKEVRLDEDTAKPSTKRQRCEDTRRDNEEPRSPLPETSSKKKRNDDICEHLENQENSDYEPDGLPEVVKRGFADIPTEKVSPYILRRTSLSLWTSSHLASRSENSPLSKQDVQTGRWDHLGEHSCSTPGGSKSQKINDEQQSQGRTAFSPMESFSRSPLCLYKESMNTVSDSTRETYMIHKAKSSQNEQALPKQDEQQENCKVQ
ncbi:centromere protein F [Cyrtonyx montezumae]|uniref:centromere protein F n=1 Tax=Cyrtonyx montezumae TaxID=9017 RepID=UPI0032DAFEB4